MDHSTGTQGTLRKHGERYLPQFKKRVLEYASNHSFKETAQEFHIHHTTVSQWMREKNKVVKKDYPLLVPPKPLQLSRAEDSFREWLEPLCLEGGRIDRELLLNKAQQFLSEDSSNEKTWFSLWVARLSDPKSKKNDNSHLTYPVWFKNTICDFSRTHGQNTTFKLFTISRKRIWDWMQGVSLPKIRGCKDGRAVTDKSIDDELVRWVQTEFQNEKIKGSVVRKKAYELYQAAGYNMVCSKGWFAKWCQRHKLLAAPRVALDSGLEEQLLHWILTKFDMQESVSHAIVRQQAIELVKASSGREDCSVSSSWVVRFCRRHCALIQQGPELQEADYPLHMQQQAHAFRVSLKHMFFLGCMDELPLNFASPLNGLERSSVDSANKSLVLLPKCPIEQCHAALMLAALEDGTLLPPSLLFKDGAEDLEDCPEVMSGLVYLFTQPGTILDNIGMQKWVQDIWFKHVDIPNALVVDCLEAHNDLTVRKAMAEISCHLAVMPGGCSTLLQPLHRGGLAAWFLARLQERWAQYLATLPILDRPLAPENRDLLHWVAELYQLAQAKPQQEMIKEGFKSAGLRTETFFSTDILESSLQALGD